MGGDAGVGMNDKKTDGGHQIETLDTHGKMRGIEVVIWGLQAASILVPGNSAYVCRYKYKSW